MFTQEERRVIIFLVSVALAGVTINFLAKKFARVKTLVCVNENLGKVNINKADQDTLMIVPGIGRKLAERIIDYRKQNYTFTSIEELQKIKGFKGYRFQKAKGMLFVE